jgi:hypothetical protein
MHCGHHYVPYRYHSSRQFNLRCSSGSFGASFAYRCNVHWSHELSSYCSCTSFIIIFSRIIAEAQVEWTDGRVDDVHCTYATFDKALRIPVSTWGSWAHLTYYVFGIWCDSGWSTGWVDRCAPFVCKFWDLCVFRYGHEVIRGSFIILFLSEFDMILADAQVKRTGLFCLYANLDDNIRSPVSPEVEVWGFCLLFHYCGGGSSLKRLLSLSPDSNFLCRCTSSRLFLFSLKDLLRPICSAVALLSVLLRILIRVLFLRRLWRLFLALGCFYWHVVVNESRHLVQSGTVAGLCRSISGVLLMVVVKISV